MNLNECPQCQKNINESTNRLIQDSCGHKKCRICLLEDETKCETCLLANSGVISNVADNNENKGDRSVSKADEKSRITVNINTSILKPVALSDHITVISKSPLLFKCTICTKTFSTSISKKYHAYCAGLEKPLKCSSCDKRFISRSHLETHELKHSGIRPFTCSVCKASFVQKSKLNRHMKIHTGDRPFVCSECGKKFSNKDALIGHYRIHSGDKPYACKKCDSKFNNKSNLSKHLSTHTKEKLFMCEECSKKFVSKWALVSHRKCHNQTRSHACHQCTKAFASIKDLRRHELTHSEVKPYGCNICKTKFCRKDNLERHLKNTHCINGVSEIKSASTKIIERKTEQECAPNKTEPDVSQTQPSDERKIEENPNAITVIKTCSFSQPSSIRNAVPVINGPFKLAFKTDAFKNNYNILKKEYKDTAPRIQTKKPYDMAESLNICQKILSPMNVAPLKNELVDSKPLLDANKPKNVIMSVGKVNEKDSLEICKKILTPIDVPSLHYETSFEQKKHALIKNIKFKLPSTYTNIGPKVSASEVHQGKVIMEKSTVTDATSATKHTTNQQYEVSAIPRELTDLHPVKMHFADDKVHSQQFANNRCKLSVIVNPHACEEP